MRVMSGALAMLPFLVLWVGCTGEVNDNTLYPCTTDADCGSGWECQSLEDAMVCVKKGSDPDISSDVGDTSSDGDGETDAVPSCTDDLKNGSETGVDCGGDSSCPRCDNQSECLVDADCLSGLCDQTASVCVATGCANGLMDSAETDVDCGGTECAGCSVGADCVGAADCASGVCTTASVCVCAAGFVADDAGGCLDINECTEGSAGCDANATCANTSGSFTCACNNGYSGDGVTCADVDECTQGTDDCSANGTCTNTVGSFTCDCDAGYSGDGVTCADDDECTANTDNCSAVATCTNTDGGFTCACNTGYTGDGVTCSNDAYVTIPSGSFTMGSPVGELGRNADETEHTVTLTHAFVMKKTEVTQSEWQALMGNNPSSYSSCGVNCPVEQTNWYDALAYANALSAAEGLAACYTLTGCTGTAGAGMTCTGATVNAPGGDPYACAGYRLPTESEWEYAYRAGTASAFYNGEISVIGCGLDVNLSAIAWYCGNASGTTYPVGLKQANGWGLFDMSGNVWEWTWDWYGAYPGTVSNPAGPGTGTGRVIRGGSWSSVMASFALHRAAYRWPTGDPNGNGVDLGFRLARTLPAFVALPAGSFTMGSPAGELGRELGEVEHTVTLTRPFEMKKTEVTQGEWQALMGNNPSTTPLVGVNGPVETVNWYEALAYANALSTSRGLVACYTLTGCTGTAGAGMTCTGVTVTDAGGDPYACTGYRLPTEAEWEYAYRAGTTSAFYNGDITNIDCADPTLETIGWYCGNANGYTHAVGQKQANAWGLFDMSGNVAEWVWDWDGPYSGTVSDPTGPGTGTARMGRGGSWLHNAQHSRAADRRGGIPNANGHDLGFRLARSLP